MDNLEDFIKNNKTELNKQAPSPDVWKRIKAERDADREAENVIPIGKPKRAALPMQIMRMAASFLILALAAFGGYKLLDTPPIEEATAAIHAELDLTDEVSELDQYYESQVSGQFAKVESLIANDEILSEVREELEMLDKEKSKLLSDYDKNRNDKEIVQALMNTYRMKLNVLENIISLLNENENEEEQSI